MRQRHTVWDPFAMRRGSNVFVYTRGGLPSYRHMCDSTFTTWHRHRQLQSGLLLLFFIFNTAYFSTAYGFNFLFLHHPRLFRTVDNDSVLFFIIEWCTTIAYFSKSNSCHWLWYIVVKVVYVPELFLDSFLVSISKLVLPWQYFRACYKIVVVTLSMQM